MPEIALTGILNPRFILGDLIHHAVMHELDVMYIISGWKDDVKVELEAELRKPLDIFDCPLTLVGRADVLIRSKETGAVDEVIEIKYVGGWGSEMPWTHHRLQAEVYCWLADCKKYTIIYVSPDGLREISGVVEDPAQVVENLLKTWSSPMWPEWECKYCDYKPWCRITRP